MPNTNITLPDPGSTTPLALAKIALTLPLLRPVAFLRSAALLLGCMIVGGVLPAILIYLSRVSSEGMKEKLPVLTMVAIAISFLGSAAGLICFARNWRRVAYAWPEHPGKVPLYNRRRTPFRASMSIFANPRARFLELAVVVPSSILCVAAVLGLYLVHFALGLTALCVLPIFPLTLLTTFRWPMSVSASVDDVPLDAQRARELARTTFRYRLAAFLWVWVPTWALALTAIATEQYAMMARTLYVYELPLIGIPVLIGAAWIHGIGALLYARLSQPVSVFD